MESSKKTKILYFVLGLVAGLAASTIGVNLVNRFVGGGKQVTVTQDLEVPDPTWEMNKSIKPDAKIFRGIIKKGSVCESIFVKGGVVTVNCWMNLAREHTNLKH